MSSAPPQRDLILLVADKNQEATLSALLGRTQAFRVRPIDHVLRVHPGRDPGCRRGAAEFLRPFCSAFRHAIVVFDREGCGRDDDSAEILETEIEKGLHRNGWGERAAAIVIDPELENWVWSDSPEVDRVMGWSGRIPPLRSWLLDRNFPVGPIGKPLRPKEAFEAALREVRKPPSSALFRQMGRVVSLERCTDRAFRKLADRLAEWFPEM